MANKYKKHLFLSLISSLAFFNSCLVMPDYIPSADSIIATELSFSVEEVILHVGGSTNLEFTLDKPESNESFIWQPADTNLISVSESGTVQANNLSGKTSITLIAENKERKKNLTASVDVTVVSNEEFFKTNERNEIIGILDTKINNLLLPQRLNDQLVTTIAADAFYDCENLRSLVIPTGYTTLSDHCFDGLSTLVNLQLPSTLTYYGVSYGYLYSLENVFFGSQDRNRNAKNNYFISNSKNYMYEIATYTDPESEETREFARILCAWKDFASLPVTIDDSTKFNVFVEEICDGAFYGLSKLRKLAMHERLRIIGTNACAFSSIQEVIFPTTITLIKPGALSSMPSLTSIKSKNETGSNRSDTYWIFGNCVYYHPSDNRTTYTLVCGCKNSSFLSDNQLNVIIGDYAFDNVFFPNATLFIPNNVTTIGKSAFRNNGSLGIIALANSVTTILGNTDSSKIIRGRDIFGSKEILEIQKTGPFYGCSNLTLKVPFSPNSIPSGFDNSWQIGVGNIEYNYSPSNS